MKKFFLILFALAWLAGCTGPGAPSPAAVPPTIPASAAAPSAAAIPTASPGRPTATLPPPPPSPTVSPSLPPPTSTPPAPPTPTTRYGSAFGIDYANPDPYRVPGKQTALTQAELDALDPEIFARLNSLPAGQAQLAGLFAWLHRDFESWRAGGSTIGVTTAQTLIKERRLGGCHDFGLVFAALARLLGYPAVMVDTAELGWLKTAAAGQKTGYSGHVFVEVFANGGWMLVDATNGPYVAQGYDPTNPVIPLGKGYYVMRKGLDSWDYGIHSNQQLQQLMDQTAQKLKGASWELPPYAVLRFK